MLNTFGFIWLTFWFPEIRGSWKLLGVPECFPSPPSVSWLFPWSGYFQGCFQVPVGDLHTWNSSPTPASPFKSLVHFPVVTSLLLTPCGTAWPPKTLNASLFHGPCSWFWTDFQSLLQIAFQTPVGAAQPAPVGPCLSASGTTWFSPKPTFSKFWFQPQPIVCVCLHLWILVHVCSA